MSKMAEAMGIKPYVIQHCRDLHTGPWETRSDLQYDTLEEAQAAFEKLTLRSMYRIAEAVPYMRYEPVPEPKPQW